jgi:hypothetical protein
MNGVTRSVGFRKRHGTITTITWPAERPAETPAEETRHVVAGDGA